MIIKKGNELTLEDKYFYEETSSSRLFDISGLVMVLVVNFGFLYAICLSIYDGEIRKNQDTHKSIDIQTGPR